MKKSWAMVVVAAALGMGCGSIDVLSDCNTVCNTKKTCTDTGLDVSSCVSMCQSSASNSSSYTHNLDVCAACVNNLSCTDVATKCAVQDCTGIP